MAKLHEAVSWHCSICGYSNDAPLTSENANAKCDTCAKSPPKCIYIRAEFKRKAYVAYYPDGRPVGLSIKENGKWVHYD